MKKIVLIFIFLLGGNLFADAKLIVDSTTIQSGSEVRFTIDASGAEDIKFPKINSVAGYKVSISGQGSSSGSFMGKNHKSKSQTYSFRPNANVEIPSYTVMIDDKAYKTKPASIKVMGNRTLKQYDRLFNAINKQRHGLTNAQIDKTKNPFILTSKKSVSSPDTNSSAEPVYVLKGIINKSANINGKWYKLNDAINEFKLTKIKDGSVILDNAGNSLELKLKNKGKENVIITIH